MSMLRSNIGNASDNNAYKEAINTAPMHEKSFAT
jgi:hypothetical protein